MYWFGLNYWSHGSTGSKICACSPQSGTTVATERYYRLAVLPLGGTTAVSSRYYRLAVLPQALRYYHSAVLPLRLRYYRDPNSTYPPQQIYFVHFFWGFASHFYCVLLFLLGWSGDGSRQHLKHKATGASGSTSVKKTAHKPKAQEVPIDVLPLPQYRAYRQANPYREEQDPSLVGTKFWNKR